MTELIKYDEARRMLAAAVAVDEVLLIRTKAAMMRAYAMQAKDRQIEIDAAQIRFRAERRLGEMIVAQRETVGLAKGGTPYRDSTDSEAEGVERVPTLREAGIDPKLSSRAQRMAAIEPEKFEKLLELHRAEVLEGNNKVSVDLMRTSAEADGREKRRELARVLSDQTAVMPGGRKYGAVYIDPPWRRHQGVTDRSYENHYPTMTWSEICALPVADLMLPDSWLFMWIPRGHLLALHEIDVEVPIAATGEIVLARVEMPLSWAVAKSFGLDNYSTCFVWTKTDEDNPDACGGAILVRDQDELLLMFKRGAGLPKPAGDEKFGSNHRERPREHSRKPEHYRKLIATMCGAGVPVLEMFARVDDAHPLPVGWDAWGNQAGAPDSNIAVSAASSGDDAATAADALRTAVAAENSATAAYASSSDGVTAAGSALQIAAVTVLTAPSQANVTPSCASVTPGFPPREWAELRAIAARAPGCEVFAPAYAARGLAYEIAPGLWSLKAAGEIRVSVLDRERAQISARFKQHLDAADFERWQELVAIHRGEQLDGSIVRGLVGEDLAAVTTSRTYLTYAGEAALAEIEAAVERADPVTPIAPAPAPAKQLDLVDLLGAT